MTRSMTTDLPQRGDIWLVSFDPTIGAEIRKTRPAVVISSDSLGVLPLKLASPITEWREDFENQIWQIKIVPDAKNNLQKVSSIDVLQTRSMDIRRFVRFVGRITDDQLKYICLALNEIVEGSQ